MTGDFDHTTVLMDDVIRAGDLARWLIENKGTKRLTAYIIAARKYNLPSNSGGIDMVRQQYHKVKTYQPSLFEFC